MAADPFQVSNNQNETNNNDVADEPNALQSSICHFLDQLNQNSNPIQQFNDDFSSFCHTYGRNINYFIKILLDYEVKEDIKQHILGTIYNAIEENGKIEILSTIYINQHQATKYIEISQIIALITKNMNEELLKNIVKDIVMRHYLNNYNINDIIAECNNNEEFQLMQEILHYTEGYILNFIDNIAIFDDLTSNISIKIKNQKFTFKLRTKSSAINIIACISRQTKRSPREVIDSLPNFDFNQYFNNNIDQFIQQFGTNYVISTNIDENGSFSDYLDLSKLKSDKIVEYLNDETYGIILDILNLMDVNPSLLPKENEEIFPEKDISRCLYRISYIYRQLNSPSLELFNLINKNWDIELARFIFKEKFSKINEYDVYHALYVLEKLLTTCISPIHSIVANLIPDIIKFLKKAKQYDKISNSILTIISHSQQTNLLDYQDFLEFIKEEYSPTVLDTLMTIFTQGQFSNSIDFIFNLIESSVVMKDSFFHRAIKVIPDMLEDKNDFASKYVENLLEKMKQIPTKEFISAVIESLQKLEISSSSQQKQVLDLLVNNIFFSKRYFVPVDENFVNYVCSILKPKRYEIIKTNVEETFNIKKSINVVRRGLTSNSSALNSIFQVLFNIPEFRTKILECNNEEDGKLKLIQNLFEAMSTQDERCHIKKLSHQFKETDACKLFESIVWDESIRAFSDMFRISLNILANNEEKLSEAYSIPIVIDKEHTVFIECLNEYFQPVYENNSFTSRTVNEIHEYIAISLNWSDNSAQNISIVNETSYNQENIYLTTVVINRITDSHYYTFHCSDSEWHKYDDENVTHVSETEVLSAASGNKDEHACMLIYRRGSPINNFEQNADFLRRRASSFEFELLMSKVQDFLPRDEMKSEIKDVPKSTSEAIHPEEKKANENAEINTQNKLTGLTVIMHKQNSSNLPQIRQKSADKSPAKSQTVVMHKQNSSNLPPLQPKPFDARQNQPNNNRRYADERDIIETSYVQNDLEVDQNNALEYFLADNQNICINILNNKVRDHRNFIPCLIGLCSENIMPHFGMKYSTAHTYYKNANDRQLIYEFIKILFVIKTIEPDSIEITLKSHFDYLATVAEYSLNNNCNQIYLETCQKLIELCKNYLTDPAIQTILIEKTSAVFNPNYSANVVHKMLDILIYLFDKCRITKESYYIHGKSFKVISSVIDKYLIDPIEKQEFLQEDIPKIIKIAPKLSDVSEIVMKNVSDIVDNLTIILMLQSALEQDSTNVLVLDKNGIIGNILKRIGILLYQKQNNGNILSDLTGLCITVFGSLNKCFPDPEDKNREVIGKKYINFMKPIATNINNFLGSDINLTNMMYQMLMLINSFYYKIGEQVAKSMKPEFIEQTRNSEVSENAFIFIESLIENCGNFDAATKLLEMYLQSEVTINRSVDLINRFMNQLLIYDEELNKKKDGKSIDPLLNKMFCESYISDVYDSKAMEIAVKRKKFYSNNEITNWFKRIHELIKLMINNNTLTNERLEHFYKFVQKFVGGGWSKPNFVPVQCININRYDPKYAGCLLTPVRSAYNIFYY